jgi:protocatechuate 3,4-dioxygenase beta subunit
VGWWNLLWNWSASTPRKSAPIVARRRSSRASSGDALRRCRFEIMEERRLLAADPIKIGAVYLEEDSGSDLHGDTFEIQFEGGHPGSELTRLVIDTDHGPAGRSVGDLIFDTVQGGWGADEAFPLQIVSKTGIDQVTWHVEDGGTKLVFDFKGFHAGDKLVFSIDVDEIQDYDPAVADQNLINEGIDPITSGVEFQGSVLIGLFKESHHHDVQGQSEFRNLYDHLFVGSSLLKSPSNPGGLPPDDYLGKRDRSTGTMATVQQVPLPITLSGYVYAEKDLDLVKDAGEAGIGGVTLALWKKEGAGYVFTGHTTTTDASGYYEFGSNLNLAPGVYQIRETQPAGYYSVGAIPGNVSGTPSGSASDHDTLGEIALPLGNLHGVRYDFAEALPSSLRGSVHVSDRNGNCEPGTPAVRPLAGVTILLKDAQGNTVAQTTTNASGEYEFTNLRPGTYSIVELQPAGLLDGDEHVGSTGGAAAGDDRIGNIVLGTGQHGTDYDFCEHDPSSLAGYVYHDVNNNGLFEAGEVGIPGATVILLDAGGTQIGQTVTDATGFYKFAGLGAGSYAIVEVTPAGYLDGKDAAGTIGGVTVGQAENPGDKIKNISLLWGGNGVQYNFGEVRPASITGLVFVDPNENCIYESGEKLLPGVTVQLLDGGGKVLHSTQTDAHGRYRFDNLPPGIYAVRELQPAGFLQGGQKAGSKGGNIGVQDLISQIPVGSGENLTDYNFCEIETVSLAGMVWSDTLPNCLLDPGEVPIAGVTLRLFDLQGNLVAATVTDSQGTYRFVELRPGTYTVRQGQPAGYFHGGQKAGSHGGDDSIADQIAGIVLRSGDSALHYDFCELPPGMISGYVFRDGPVIPTADGRVPPNLHELRDGQLTPDDQRIAGVWLELRHSGTADPVLGSEPLPSIYGAGPIRVRTNASGYYEFRGLPQGNYTIIEIQPEGYLDGIDTPGTTSGLAVNPNSVISPSVLAPFTLAGIDLRNDAILRVPLGIGQQSLQNNFSEVQVAQPWVPPTLIEAPTTPPLPEPIVVLPPPPVFVTPPITLPPPAAPMIGGGNANQTWHLSVIDAGLPRVASRTTKTTPVSWRRVMFVDATQWKPEKMRAAAWRLRAADGSVANIEFGTADAIPVVGDFNGDGKDEMGIYIRGEWLLDLNGNGQWDSDDLWAHLGSKGDQPVVGDWDGDGKDDIGIFGIEWAGDRRHMEYEPGLPDHGNAAAKRPKNVPPDEQEATTGQRLLRLTARGRERSDLIDHVFQFGVMGDVPIAGDLNGDGIRSIGVFHEGRWHFDVDGDGRRSDGDVSAQFGQAGDIPIVGDFNGDGIDEIGVFRAGRWIIDTNGNRRIDAGDETIDLGQAGDRPVVGDFDGDGRDEPGLFRS